MQKPARPFPMQAAKPSAMKPPIRGAAASSSVKAGFKQLRPNAFKK